MFCKQSVFKNVVKLVAENLCWSFFNKVAGLRPAMLLKNRIGHSCFPVSFVKLRAPIYFTPPAAASSNFKVLYTLRQRCK